MNLKEYMVAAARTMPKDRNDEQQLSMLGLGLTGEYAEMADAIFASDAVRKPSQELSKEIGDVMWYCANLVNKIYGDAFQFEWEKEVQTVRSHWKVIWREGMTDVVILEAMFDVGQIAEAIKKSLYHGKSLDLPKLDEHIGSVIITCMVFAERFGLHIGTILAENVEKLKKRYPDGFSVEASLNRRE